MHKKLPLLLMALLFGFSFFAYASESPSQKITCTGNTCKLYALTTQGPVLVTSGPKSDVDQYYSGWTDQATNLATFSIACGTACNYGYFVDYQTGQISDNFYLVESINIAKRIIALPNPNDNNDQSLLVRHIFSNNPGIVIKRNFDPDVENAIQDIKFDQQGNLYIDYLTTPNYTEVKETIPIDYSKFNLADS